MPTPAAERFRQAFAACHVALPLTVSPEDPATLIDEHGNDVLTVDVNGWRNNSEVAAIARLIADALNAARHFTDAATVERVIANTAAEGVAPAEEDPACRCRPAGWGGL